MLGFYSFVHGMRDFFAQSGNSFGIIDYFLKSQQNGNRENTLLGFICIIVILLSLWDSRQSSKKNKSTPGL
jgi:hypothetical protein